MKHVTTLTGEPLESLSPALAKQEAERIEALQRLRRLRKEAAAEIERLLEFMDASDIDPDLEETADDEPSLGWPATGHCGGVDDLEAEPEHDEDGDPAEPSLGSVGDAHFDQTQWASGGRRDLEQDGAESGIGDQDGMDEQLGPRDWQPIFFV
jgi:hypothetical protein